eukprot:GEMP01048411.1.p1 GENE.GEMP01048411.1~~GEMP01048411.1.p1  ORF type:complete len:276 (+),score=46.08 GEMP01048411.1:173-1000(+)
MSDVAGEISGAARPFFGWRIFPQRWLNGAGPGSGYLPYVHNYARVVALLYIVALHGWMTYAGYQRGEGATFLRRYLLFATRWALFLSLLYFVLINCYVIFSPRGTIPALVGPSQPTDSVALPRLLRVCAAVLQIATIAQLTITCLFWAWIGFFYQGGNPEIDSDSTLLAIQAHGVVCLCVAGEFFFTRIPAYSRDVVLVAILFVLYICVNAGYTLITGTPVYPVLTWKDNKSVAMVGGGLLYFCVWTFIMHLFHWWQRGTCCRQHDRKESDTDAV